MTDVGQSEIVKEDLLDYEYGYGFAQLRSRLHYAQTQGNDLSTEEEVDHFRGVILDQSPNDAKRSQAKVLERSGL